MKQLQHPKKRVLSSSAQIANTSWRVVGINLKRRIWTLILNGHVRVWNHISRISLHETLGKYFSSRYRWDAEVCQWGKNFLPCNLTATIEFIVVLWSSVSRTAWPHSNVAWTPPMISSFFTVANYAVITLKLQQKIQLLGAPVTLTNAWKVNTVIKSDSTLQGSVSKGDICSIDIRRCLAATNLTIVSWELRPAEECTYVLR